MADDDAMWRRAADDLPQPTIAFDSFTVSDDEGGTHEVTLTPGGSAPDEPARRPRRTSRLRGLVGSLAVAVMGIAAFVGVQRLTDDADSNRPIVDVIADSRRLPQRVDRLWSATIDTGDTGDTGDTVSLLEPPIIFDGRNALISLLDSDDFVGSTGIAFDPVTGDELWRRRFDFTSRTANLLGTIDGTLIVEQNDLTDRQLLGIAPSTGEVTWTLPTRDNGIHIILSGTDVITRVSFTGNERLTFIDPTTGDEVARTSGRLIGTDLSGTWYIRNGRRVTSIDLTDGYSEPIDVATDTALGVQPAGVVDGHVIVVETDGALALVDPDGSSNDTPLIPLVALGGDLPDVVALVATGGPTFMAVGDGKVIGATLAGTDVVIRWQTNGSVRVVAVAERGLLAAISDADGITPATQIRVLDGVTGEQLATSASTQDIELLPQLLGNGFVTTRTGGLGLERIGYDLDGNEQWRLAGNTPIRLGDRILATSSVGPDGFTITAFGEAV